MTRADKAVRAVAVAAVLGVAAVAAWVSYRHCVTVVSAYGEGGWVGRFYPATIDGLIVASSMVLLDAARSRTQRPALAMWMLGAGIAATLTVNVLAGVAHGPMGAVWSAWPAGAFIGAYEALMLLVRAGARRAVEAASQPAAAQVAHDAEQAAQNALRATAAAGNPLSGRQLADRFGLNRAQVASVRAAVLPANGHPVAEGGDA